MSAYVPVRSGASLEQEPVGTPQTMPVALSVPFHSVEAAMSHRTFAEIPPSPLPLQRREPARSTAPEHSDKLLSVVAGGCNGILPVRQPGTSEPTRAADKEELMFS